MNINKRAEEIIKYVIGDMYALDFTQEDFDEIFNELDVAYPKYQPYYKKGVIKQFITKIFSLTHQDVYVDIVDEKLELTKEFVDPKKPEEFDRAMHEINLNLMDVDHNIEQYKPFPYLIVLPESIRNQLFELIEPFEKKRAIIREYLRNQFYRVLDCSDKDIVLFLRNRIYIRNFSLPRELPAGVDKRFNGASIHEMQELYEDYFPNGAWEHLEEYVDEILDKEFNFGQISNSEFSDRFIPVFKSLIESVIYDIEEQEIENEVKLSEIQVDSLASYVLRRFFNDILSVCVKSLLVYVEMRNKNAEKFIRYFTDEIIINEKGEKVQKYALLDSENNRWNYNSIVAILMQWKQAKVRVAKQEEKLESVGQYISSTEEELQRLDKSIEKSKVNFTKRRSETIATEAQLRRLENDLKIERSSKKIQELNLDIITVKAVHVKNLDIQKEAEKKLNIVLQKEQNCIIALHSWEKNLMSAKETMKEINIQNEKITNTYLQIVSSIVKVILR